MSSTPPRRSRPKPPRSRALPVIPIIIGLVVLGFVIGAGLSMMGSHPSPNDTVAVVTSSPVDESGPSPTPIPAISRTPRPTDSPESTASPLHSSKPSAAASRRPHPAASKAPEVALNAASASPVPPVSPSPVDTASTPADAVTPATQTTSGTTSAPATRRPSTPAPPIAATLVPASPVTAAPAAATPGTAALDSDSEFSRLAGNVVRQYLLSLSRGDTESAYAALGDGPASRAGTIPEVGAVDSTMHISKIQARGGDSAATVNVDLTTATGSYYGQYTVHKSATGAAIIVSHTFGKP